MSNQNNSDLGNVEQLQSTKVCCPKPVLFDKIIIDNENGEKIVKPDNKQPNKKMRKAFLLKQRIK